MILEALQNVIRDAVGNPPLFALRAILLVVAITLHEWGHAAMATWCGDPTPRNEGRVTLNPLAHLDPMGTIGMLFFGFGWGKPVMIQPGYFRNGRWDHVKVAAAGPAMNLLQAVAFALALKTVVSGSGGSAATALILYYGMAINVGLMVFNLIPVGPLDGATILKGFLPLRAAYEFHQFNRNWGTLLMFGLVMTGSVGLFLKPVQHGLFRLVGL